MALKKVKRPVNDNDGIKLNFLTNQKSAKETDEKVNFLNYLSNDTSSIITKIDLPHNDENIIILESIMHNIETGECFANIEHSFKGKKQKHVLRRDEYLNRKGLLKLQKYGANITEDNARSVVKSLNLQEECARSRNIHAYVGFDKFQQEHIFKHFTTVNASSEYTGNLDIQPKGTKADWYHTVIPHVVKNIPLQAMLVIGFSSAIVGFLSTISECDSLLVHISGDSTTGKTTASMLAISIWGNPSTKIPNGLATTWNTTENAMFKNIVGNHGLAVLFDEVSMNDSLEFTKFIYKFTGNKDKARLNSESKAETVGSWATTILSNGEFSLLEKSKKNTGAKMRIMDFYNVAWTKDAESADSIRECITQNYGHIGLEFVQKLFDYGIENIYEDVQETKIRVIKSMQDESFNDKFLERRAWQYAILIYTGEQLIELLHLPIDIHKIWDFFMENESQAAQSRNLQKNAFNYFLEYFNSNYKRFLQSNSLEPVPDDSLKNPTTDILGKINILPNKEYIEVCIFPEQFTKLMKAGGFEDTKIILKQWKDEGKLDAEADRYTRKRKIIENGGTLPLYVIRVAKDDVLNEK